MPNGRRQATTSASFRTSSRPVGRSISMPTISIEQNEFAFATGWSNVEMASGILTSASVSTTISI